jgi:hypothetical protein
MNQEFGTRVRFLDHPEGSDTSDLLRYLRLMKIELSKKENEKNDISM